MEDTFWDYIDIKYSRFGFIYFLLVGAVIELVPFVFIIRSGWNMLYIPTIIGPIIIEILYLFTVFRGYSKFKTRYVDNEKEGE